MKILFLPSYFYPEQAASSYLGDNIRTALKNNPNKIKVTNLDKSISIDLKFTGSRQDIEILLAGGYLNYIKSDILAMEGN